MKREYMLAGCLVAI